MKIERMRPRRRMVAALATTALAVGTLTGVAPDARAAAGFELQRVAGANRYETAAKLATAAFASGSTNAVLASGENFPDALAGSFLAGRFGAGAPILLTTRDDLPAVTAAALEELGVTDVYILGGTAAVGEGVVEDLAGYEVTRIAGNDRYQTAAEIAEYEADGLDAPGSTGGAKTVVVASGAGFADALAAGPLAFKGNLPIVLTPAAKLATAARTAIDNLEAAKAWIVGGTAAVGTAVENELKQMGLTTVRIAGPSRYDTAVAAATRARSELGFSSSGIDLASGENFPDALAAGPASGVANRPLLLTAAASLSDPTEKYLVDHSETLTEGRVFGGPAAVSEATVTQAEAAGRAGETLGEARIVGIDRTNNRYRYVREGVERIITVVYEDGDAFTVDGVTATVGGFESSATVGDVIEVDNDPTHPDAVGAPSDEDVTINGQKHELSNVSSGFFTSGTVGNVDLADDQLDIIEPVSGVTFRPNITYSGTFRVDAGNADLATFEEDLNEGDSIAIAGGFNLTNRDVTGEVTNAAPVEPPDAVIASARFTVDDALGDIPGAGSDGGADDANNDNTYRANCSAAQSGQTFAIDNASSTCDAFVSDITDGDQITYRRKDGIEAFLLVNDESADVEGIATSRFIRDGDGNGDDPNNTNPLIEANDVDGGSFSMIDDAGDLQRVVYDHTGTVVVDGRVSDEASFEREYSAGDAVVYRPADADSSTDQYLELTNDDLEGLPTEENAAATPADNDTHSPGEPTPPAASNPAFSYTVERFDGDLTGQQRDDELEVVVYFIEGSEALNLYYVNGVAKSRACFEDLLDNATRVRRSGGDSPHADDDVNTVHDAVWAHDLTVTGPTC